MHPNKTLSKHPAYHTISKHSENCVCIAWHSNDLKWNDKATFFIYLASTCATSHLLQLNMASCACRTTGQSSTTPRCYTHNTVHVESGRRNDMTPWKQAGPSVHVAARLPSALQVFTQGLATRAAQDTSEDSTHASQGGEEPCSTTGWAAKQQRAARKEEGSESRLPCLTVTRINIGAGLGISCTQVIIRNDCLKQHRYNYASPLNARQHPHWLPRAGLGAGLLANSSTR